MRQPSYNIYPSLLDKFASYINSSQIYQEYYGFSEEPAISEDEFEKQKFDDLINGINRVPFESEAADKGTMFNEVIDCIIENQLSEKMVINTIIPGLISVKWKNREFHFNRKDCSQIAKLLKGSICQNFQDGYLETKYGFVRLYGYSDYLMKFRIVDLKTTSKYNAFKFRNNWQHIVYPFLLHYNGIFLSDFTYLVYKWTKDGGDIFEEEYTYNENVDLPKLQNFIEQFIEFLNTHKHLITDKKIFNLIDRVAV